MITTNEADAELDSTERTQLRTLISLLSHKDGMKREGARESLVVLGEPAVPMLMAILRDGKNPARWEAAKALSEIGSERSTELLVDCLTDEDSDIRWLASEGIIEIGLPAMKPTLRALLENPDSHWLRESVHHVMHDLHGKQARELMHPLLSELREGAPAEIVQSAAREGLKVIEALEE